jgi:multidrug transporter EmrE-like cation transporter
MSLTSWILVLAAAASNVLANVMLKKTITALPAREGVTTALKTALGMGSFWAFGFACVFLLTFYILALRTLDLSVAYAVVTSSALIGMVAASAWLLDEPATVIKITGCLLIIVGIFLISKT